MSTNASANQNKLVVSFSQSTQSLFSEDPSGFQLDSSLNKFYSADYSEEEAESDNDDESDLEDDDCINYSIVEDIAVRYMYLHGKNLEESSRYFPRPERPYDKVWEAVAGMLPESALFISARHKYTEMCPVGALGFYFLSYLRNSTDSQRLTSENLPLWFHQLAVELSTQKAKVDCRNYEARVYCAAQDFNENDRRLCRFNAERLEIELPPRSLLFPLPRWLVEFRTDCIRDDAYSSEPFGTAKQALSKLTEFIVYVVQVTLQDGAVLYLKNPRHPLLNTHGVFQSAQFKEYVEGFETKARALKPRQLRACA